MSTFNELHHCTSNLHSEKRPVIFQNTEHIHRVIPVPQNHLLRFQGIECKFYIIVIYVVKCIQIPLTLSINFKLPYKTCSAVPSPFGPIELVCLGSVWIRTLSQVRLLLVRSNIATYFVRLSHLTSLGEGCHVNYRRLSRRTSMLCDLTVREHWGENMVLCTRIWWWEPPPTNLKFNDFDFFIQGLIGI